MPLRKSRTRAWSCSPLPISVRGSTFFIGVSSISSVCRICSRTTRGWRCSLQPRWLPTLSTLLLGNEAGVLEVVLIEVAQQRYLLAFCHAAIDQCPNIDAAVVGEVEVVVDSLPEGEVR